MFWTNLKKKSCFAAVALMACVSITCVKAHAQSVLDACDYDNVFYANATVTVEGTEATLDLSDFVGNGKIRKVPAHAPVVKQLQESMSKAEPAPDMDGSWKEVAVLMRLNDPVCAVNYTNDTLFVREFIEKDTYYAVSVCLPESGTCWFMKINKNSYLGGRLKLHGVKLFPKGVYHVDSAEHITILSLSPAQEDE